MKSFLADLKVSLVLTLILAALLCGAYPLAVWAGGQALFPRQANGSLITDADGAIRGSALLAQGFTNAKYFHPRPSAAGVGYDAAGSSGSNLGPTSRTLADRVRAGVATYRIENSLAADAPVPADAVTTSGSGLDPHISIANAELQAARVARARGLPLEQVRALIRDHTIGRQFQVLGEPGINVLLVNRALDATAPASRPNP